MADTEKKDAPEVDEQTESEETKPRYQSSAETVGPCKIELTITVPVETIEEEFDERYGEIIRTVAFPGFRVGHAPRRLVEKRLGDEVRNDVREHIISESFKEAIDRHDIEPLSEPEVDLESIELEPGHRVEFQATIVVRPTVTIPDYTEIALKKVPPVVSDEKVEEMIQDLRRQHSLLEPVEGEVEAEDIAIVDVAAHVEDEKILERENVEYQHPTPYLAGLSLPSLPSLPDEILGKSAGDELTVTETLPDTWSDQEQAGKDLRVTVTVQDVKRSVLPELDDQFAETLDYDSLEELREEIEEQVSREAEREAQEKTDRAMVTALVEAAPFELPEDVVKEELGRRIERTQAMLRMRGASEEEVEEKLAEARNAERAEVELEFRAAFLLDAIAKKEKVFVTENEVEERIAEMAAAYRRTPEEMEQYLEQRDMLGSIRSGMREEKVKMLLRKKMKIEG